MSSHPILALIYAWLSGATLMAAAAEYPLHKSKWLAGGRAAFAVFLAVVSWVLT